jgi:hypothetical protein
MYVPLPVPPPASLQQHLPGSNPKEASTVPVSDLFW